MHFLKEQFKISEREFSVKNIFKNKKAIIIAACAVVVIIGIIATALLLNGGFGPYSDPTIAVEDVEGKVGDTVKVPVKVYKNPGVMSFLLSFQYDDSILSYEGYENGDVLSNYQFNDSNGNLAFVNLEQGDVDKDGVMFYLNFKILKNEKENTEIKINITGEDAANSAEQFVKFEGSNGTVTIKK